MTLNILIDTREQDPLLFVGCEDVQISRELVPAGDYTLVGHDMPGDDHSVAFERKKNCQELCGNLGTGWDRFVREAEKLQQYTYKQIVVCGHDNFLELYNRKFTQLHPNFIYKRLAELHINYGITTIFLPNREIAQNYIFRHFKDIARRTSDEN